MAKKKSKQSIYVMLKKYDISQQVYHPIFMLLISYLFFKRDQNDDITTSVCMILEELGLGKYSGVRSPKSYIIENLKKLIRSNIIEFLPRSTCPTVDDITLKNIFVLHFDFDKYTEKEGNFVTVNLEEFQKFQDYIICEGIEDRTDKIYNLYLYIKQFISDYGDDFGMCFAEDANIIKMNKLNKETFEEYIQILIDAGLLYRIQLKHPISVNSQVVKTVYTLEKHTEKEIVQQFKKYM